MEGRFDPLIEDRQSRKVDNPEGQVLNQRETEVIWESDHADYL